MKKLILASLLLSAALPAAGSAYATALYFPHIATSIPWQTEIAIINTSDQTVTGALRALDDEGQLVGTKDVTLSARGRRQITVADEFTDHTSIGYIIFDADSSTVEGYTKFSREGYYRVAIPAVKEVNTSDIYISHIASTADWWTGISLLNTTSVTKELTITFNTGQSVPYILTANQHRAFEIAQELFNNQPQPGIQSAVITNASGIIGLELFGNTSGSNHLDGLLLANSTASTIYYPHVASNNEWWTGIVAYNPSGSACTITITPYSANGTALTPSTLPIPGKGKYIGAVADLGLPAETAWFKIDSTSPITGFELFGTVDGNQLAAYAEVSGTGAYVGVFPRIEKNGGWTGIAFVNTEAGAASVTLTGYNDTGTAVATQVLPVGGYAKVVNNPEQIFSQDISSATYIVYSSDRNIVGFQLNGSSDGMMLDALPGLAGGDTPTATEVGVPNGSLVSATIGAAGGSLSATDGKLALTIPAGALATNTVIGIQPITNMAHGKFGAAYQLTPDGQTFLKPVTLTFAYTDEDLKGTAAKFLGAAFQTADGYWQWFGDATVDTTAKTVSVVSTHFTGVSGARRLMLLPKSKTVKVKKRVALKVVYCYQRVLPEAPGSGGELVILGRDCVNRGRQREYPGGVSKWSVNTIEGGDDVLGTVSGSGNTATYVAPATKPSPNTVAVTALVDQGALGIELVASDITIEEDTLSGTASATNPLYSVTTDVVWTLESTVDKVATYRPSGTATLSGALYSGLGCIYSPLTGPIDPGSGAVLIVDYNSDPPTYHGGGATSWPATITCPPHPAVINVTLTALYFGGGNGPLGTEAQGLVSGEGTIIEGTDTMGDVIFNWNFILD